MNIQYEIALSVVKDYAEYLNFTYELYGYDTERFSYCKWAVSEVLKCLEYNQTSAPLFVIENFRDKMKEYSRMNQKSKIIFSAAYETAEEIIDLFM